MSIRYPSLDEFWPAVRAKNFVRALGEKATNYEANMKILAARAGVHWKQMDMVNPLTFADRNWLSVRTKTSLMNMDTRSKLEWIRQSTYHPSTKWAYAMKEPIPPYVKPVAKSIMLKTEPLAEPSAEPLAKPQAEPLAKPQAEPSAEPCCRRSFNQYDYGEIELEKKLYTAIQKLEGTPKDWCIMANQIAVNDAFRLATMDGMDTSVLIQAAHLGHVKVVEMIGDLLVRDSVGVDFSYSNNFTALMYAAQAGHMSVVKALIRRGANITLKNSNGETAAERATASGYPEIATLLNAFA